MMPLGVECVMMEERCMGFRAEDLWTVAFLFNVTCGHASGIEG